jgi:hypothetical protein
LSNLLGDAGQPGERAVQMNIGGMDESNRFHVSEKPREAYLLNPILPQKVGIGQEPNEEVPGVTDFSGIRLYPLAVVMIKYR